MSQVKQIEEMANVLTYEIAWDEDEIPTVNCLETAKRLYNLGYRKQSEGEWISVEERLPKEYRNYLVVVTLKYDWETEWEVGVDMALPVGIVGGHGEIDDMWDTCNDWNEGQEIHITHWRPLPEPPKMKGGEG